MNGNLINFVNIININNKDKLILDVDTKLIFNKDFKYVIILDIKFINGYLNYNINIYIINDQKVLNILDKKINNNIFFKTIDNIINDINNKILITNIIINMDLDLIKNISHIINSEIYKFRNLNRNKLFISIIDLETFKFNSISRVFAASSYIKQFRYKIFYIDKNYLNSDLVIINMINLFLNFIYIGYNFYIYNFGNFNLAFILKILIIKNQKRKDDNEFDLNTLCKDKIILSLTISVKIKSKIYIINLIHIYNILSYNHKKLYKTYKIKVSKDIFSYDFININSLFYNNI